MEGAGRSWGVGKTSVPQSLDPDPLRGLIVTSSNESLQLVAVRVNLKLPMAVDRTGETQENQHS